MGSSERGRQSGFTLIELLVVIAILAILAGLLFPVFAKARERARSAACLSNLRQLGNATQLYADDHDGRFPFGADWADRHYPQIWSTQPGWQALLPSMPDLPDLLESYTANRQIWECPSDSGVHRDPLTDLEVNVDHAYRTFGLSYTYRTELAFSGLTVDSLVAPAETNLLEDADGSWHDGTRNRFETYRFNGLYADGHAKSLSWSQMMALWQQPL